MTSSPEQHFPADYREAREAFMAAAEADGFGITSRVHAKARGADGKPLFMDVAAAGARSAKRALLLISGTHGVEGYFGSGVQTGLLRMGLAKRVPKGAKLVLLHALNPFGFSWNRRVNEHNADINRNFVDHARPPANEAYDTLADAIAPRTISPGAFKKANASTHPICGGAWALRAAGSHQPRPISSSRRALFRRLAGELVVRHAERCAFREKLRGKEELVVIDFHTGLGETGALRNDHRRHAGLTGLSAREENGAILCIRARRVNRFLHFSAARA